MNQSHALGCLDIVTIHPEVPFEETELIVDRVADLLHLFLGERVEMPTGLSAPIATQESLRVGMIWKGRRGQDYVE